MGATRHKDTATGRSVAMVSAALIASFLTACTTAGDPGLGLAPQTQQPTLGYSDAGSAGNTGSGNPVAVEMSFGDGETETVPYANATAQPAHPTPSKKPRLALAVAPETTTSAALEAVNTAAPSTATTKPPDPDTARVDRPAPKQRRLARLFSFGQPRPPAEIVHVAGGGRPAKPDRGAASTKPRSPIRQQPSGQTDLPGVRLGSLFGIKTGTTASAEAPIQLASAAGLARLAPNGLRAQHDSVQMTCFKPELVRLLQRVRRHYGRDVIVTSGYRSAKYNRRAGGARGSRHTTCEAADIQVAGVGKWQLAKYLRTVPGRGGVGTYCHTKSVHIDVGSERDWNWRCRRR